MRLLLYINYLFRDFLIYKPIDDVQEFDSEIEQILLVMIARKFALILYETIFIVNFPIYMYTIKNFRYL